MFIQIVTGTALLTVNIIISALAAFSMEMAFRRFHPWLLRPPQRPKLVLMLVGVSLWVLAVTTAGVWVWALAYLALDAFPDLETAVYFSLVTLTTVGFGDVVLPPEWRLLAGMEATNGFLSFGLLTALMVETLRQVRLSQIETRRRSDS